MGQAVGILIAVLVVAVVAVVLIYHNKLSGPVSEPVQGVGDDYTRLFSPKGCWADNSSRMLKNIVNMYPLDLIQCSQIAKSHGHKYFAAQAGYQCATGNDKYWLAGPSNNCTYKGGDGTWANTVYQVIG